MLEQAWLEDLYVMKKLLKQIDAYVKCGDFQNAKHLGEILAFKARMCPQYEEERRKRLKCLNKNCTPSKTL